MRETGYGVYGNSLYYLCNFSLNLKLFLKQNKTANQRAVHHLADIFPGPLHIAQPGPQGQHFGLYSGFRRHLLCEPLSPRLTASKVCSVWLRWCFKRQCRSTKEKIDKFDYINTENAALWKTLLREWKDKPQTGRKYLKNIYKWAKDPNSHLTKEDIQVANKCMTGCSISYVIAEIQVKATMRHHSTPMGMAKIK